VFMSYSRLSLNERIQIEKYLSHDESYSVIGERLSRNKSSISREVSPFGRSKYKAVVAQHYSDMNASFRKKGHCKLDSNTLLRSYVEKKLNLRWSPEEISRRLEMDYPEDTQMRVSHESIYSFIYLRSKKGLRECLRQAKKKRGRPRAGAKDKRGKIPDAISIEERPAEVEGREIPGHWEGDLIVGKGHKSAIGTLAERTTRSVIIVPLQGMDAHTVRKAFEKAFATIPRQMKKTMTYDNGKEMSEHKLFTANSKVKVYFARPYSPWERPTNENTNGLIRDYFPKGTDFNTITIKRLKEVQDQLNSRPRKVLEWHTPGEVFCRLAGQWP